MNKQLLSVILALVVYGGIDFALTLLGFEMGRFYYYTVIVYLAYKVR